MKKIIVYGYKKLNFGDDLFFSLLTKRYPKEKFLFLGQKEYKKVFRNCKNIKVISPYSPTDIFFSLFDKIFSKNKENILARKAKCKILITGSGFAEQSLEQLRKMPLNDRKLFIIGANFGPYKTEQFLNACEKYFEACHDVCFRDLYSYNLFSHLNNIRTAPDIIFDINSYYNDLPTHTDFIKASDKYAVISLISFNARSKNQKLQENYIEGIKRIANYLITKGLKIVLFSFCTAEGDGESANEIMQDAHIQKNSYHYSYTGDIPNALSIIYNSQIVIATRFHAMILGFAMNKKVLPIIYDQKMTNVLNDIDYPYVYKANEIAEISVHSLETWYNSNTIKDFSDIIMQSKDQFKELDAFLFQ